MNKGIREGLGYTLKDYNPCVNFNADRFCCSNRGYAHRENILLSDCPLTRQNNFASVDNFSASDLRPLWLKETGLVDPTPYTFAPQARAYTWCGRMPCTMDSNNQPPCQKNMPTCKTGGTCGAYNRDYSKC